MSVFYSFYYYLGAIDIPVAWRGFLVGLEPMAAFVLRLLVLPWLHVRNAYGTVMIALAMLIVVSCSYLFVTGVTGMLFLRVIHGAVFVLLTSALISLLVNFIPPKKSGRGFSALAVATMIPYAVIPPLTEALLPHLRNEADIYAGVSLLSVVAIMMMLAMRRPIDRRLVGLDAVLMRRPDISEVRDNFRQFAVVAPLFCALLIYLAHATIFYFLKNLSLQTGAGNVGVFFTVLMASMIAVRIFGAVLFDRADKQLILVLASALMIVCLVAMPTVTTSARYYLLAAVYGSGIGVALPILNAFLCSASAPAMRGLNTNMTLFAMDAGYFITPYLGGALIAFGANFNSLFYVAAAYVVLTLLITSIKGRRRTNPCHPPS